MEYANATLKKSASSKKPTRVVVKTWVYRHLPILQWLPRYNIGVDLKFDIIAGITVGMMIIPQEVSLAQIMKVPSQYGLYTAAIVPMIYPIFGTSRVLSVANAAEVSLLVGSVLGAIENEEERIATGIFMSFFCGMLMLAMGVCHLGMMVDFFSRPVMGGFVSAGGILIMLSQVPNYLGLKKLPHSDFAFETLYNLLAKQIQHTDIPSFLLGTGSIIMLILMKYAKNHWIPATQLDDVFSDGEVTEKKTDIAAFDANPEIEDPHFTSEYSGIGTPTAVGGSESSRKPRNLTNVNWSFSLTDSDFLSLESLRQQQQQKSNINLLQPLCHLNDKEDNDGCDHHIHNSTSLIAKSDIPLVVDDETLDHEVQNQQVKKSSRSKWTIIGWFIIRTCCDLGALVICICGILFGRLFYDQGVWKSESFVTGHIPSGFPAPLLPWYSIGSLIPYSKLSNIAINGFAIAIVAYMSSIAMAKRLAIKGGYEVDPNQELLGIGMGSVVGACFQGMPPTGAMSRTAVNALNARTQLASIITSFVVICCLLFFTSALFYLPKASLSAIIIVAAFSLVELEEAKWLYKVKRDEFWVWTASFVLTVALGVLPGLVLSIGSSLVAIMYRTKRPPLIILGQYTEPPQTDAESPRSNNGAYHVITNNKEKAFVDISLFPQNAVLYPHIVVVRVEQSLYFANCEHVQRQIEASIQNHSEAFHKQQKLVSLGNEEYLENEDELDESIQAEMKVIGVVVDTCSINDWDATALSVMTDLTSKLALRNISFGIANARINLRKALDSSGFSEKLIQKKHTSLSIEQVVEIFEHHHKETIPIPVSGDVVSSTSSGSSFPPDEQI